MTNHPTDQPDAPTDRPTVVGGRTSNWLGAAFYFVVAAVALAGQTTAAVGTLHWSVWFALPAVGALELGGIALSAQADYRRRLGERAIAARLLSAAVAVFAVVFNWVGHIDRLAGGFFAGMSALGYLVWLIQSGNRRRDQLRAERKLPPVPPAYPVGQWLRHPIITNRARGLALADTTLSLYGSLEQARSLIREERRQQAIAKVLRKEIGRGGDRLAARIAVTTYDLDQVATRLRDQADYNGLTGLVAARLDPTRLIDQQPPTTPVVKRPTNPRPVLSAGPTGRSAQPTSRSTRPADQGQTDQPAEQPAPAEPRRLQVVGEPAAVRNARRLRELYPTGLPAVERTIRNQTGWSKVRVEAAVASYNRGDDIQPPQDGDEGDDKEPQPEPAAVSA